MRSDNYTVLVALGLHWEHRADHHLWREMLLEEQGQLANRTDTIVEKDSGRARERLVATLADAQAQEQQLRKQAGELRLHGLLSRWSEVMRNNPEQARWVAQLLGWEAAERHRRSLERRLRAAHIGPFKPLADFDWKWPTQCDRGVVEELMTLAFLEDASNVVLVGPNGVGKTMCACNLGYQAVLAGRTALFITAAQLLGELASLDSDSALRRRLRHYAAPDLLMIDEVGYLSYSNRHADLLFELISRRYQHKSTVVTTNKPFAEWGEVFPNAACVVSLIDRLMHRAEVVC